MDIATILGLVLGIGALLGSFLMEGGHLGALIQLPAMLLVILGTFGATVITTSLTQVKALPEIIKIAVFEKRLNPQQLIELIYELAQKARKNGLLSLEKDLATIKEPFLKKALQSKNSSRRYYQRTWIGFKSSLNSMSSRKNSSKYCLLATFKTQKLPLLSIQHRSMVHRARDPHSTQKLRPKRI